MRTFQGSGRNSTLARALGEYGRIGKTLHLLDLADDELYRRSLLIQVNKGERRHGLARTVFHGRGGELRQAYREGQEDQLGALGLVAIAAGRVMLVRLEELASQRVSFGFETTLASRSFAPWLRMRQADGY